MTAKGSDQDALNRLLDTRLCTELRDLAQRRATVYSMLADHPDPVLREIGQQLRDGLIRPIDLVRIDAYGEIVQRGIDATRTFDIEKIANDAANHDSHSETTNRRAREK